MKKQPEVLCVRCGAPYPPFGAAYLCCCGGVYDYSRFPEYIQPVSDGLQAGLNKYQLSLGLPQGAPLITLGEGNTPLLRWSLNGRQVFIKMEGHNPTGSYKDRGSCVLTSFLISRGVTSVVEDSSGNAGASLAAYCARANLPVTVYIPKSASGPKRWQIEMYGAIVQRVVGPRENAARAVLRAVSDVRVYASHAYMPFGLPGIATIAYELCQQLGRPPTTLIAPVGHGGLLYGIMLGFEAMLASGDIDCLPYYIGVQPENCSPVAKAFLAKSTKAVETNPQPTIAEGASVAEPLRGEGILQRMLSGGGEMQTAQENALRAVYTTAARAGVFCEPTACLSLIPLLNDKIELQEPIVAILTGAGLKTGVIY